MSVDFGAAGTGGDPLAGYNPTPYTPPHSGGPFINWTSPISVLSSPFRATEAGIQAGGGLIESATRGLPMIPIQAAREGINDVKATYGDIAHPGTRSFSLLTSPFGSAFTKGAVQALPALGGVKTEPWSNTGLPGQTTGPDQPVGLQPFLAGVAKQSPTVAPFLGSLARTGTDIEQLQRSFGNRVLPGTPFGADVGQMGSGAGLLGKTDFAKAAARGGGGVLPKALEDVTNLSLVGQPVEQLIGAGARSAAEEAAAHAAAQDAAEKAAQEATKGAESNVDQAAQQYERAVQARADAAQQASGGHPAAAAAYQAADQGVQSAGEALRQAQEAAAQVAREHGANVDLASQTAEGAQARSDQMAQRLETMKLVNKLGSKAAASPFAPMELGLSKVIGPAASAIAGSDLGQRFIGPIVDRAQGLADQMERNRQVANLRNTMQNAQRDVGQQLEKGFERTAEPLPTAETEVKRGPFGLFGHKTVQIPDVDAAEVAKLGQTEVGLHLGNLVRERGPEEGIQIFAKAHPNEFTPEQLQLAAEVFGPAADDQISEQAAQVRAAIPEVRARYGEVGGALGTQNARYRSLLGEAGIGNVRPEPGAGAFAQVEHNLEGDSARIDSLEEWQRAQDKYDRERAKLGRVHDKTAKQLAGAQEKLGALGLSPEEQQNPRALLARLYEAPTAAARAIADQGAHVWAAMAQSPEKGLAQLGEKVASGRLSAEEAIPKLTEQIIKLARKDPDKLSPVALTLVEEAKQRGMADVGREAAVANVSSVTAPVQRLGAGVERARAGAALEQTGAANLERSDRMYGEAMDKLGAPTRDVTAKVAAAGNRVAAAAVKLSDLVRKVQASAGTVGEAEKDLFDHAGVSRREVAQSVLDIRREIKADFAAQADAIDEELSRQGIDAMRPPEKELKRTVIRKAGAEQKGQVVRRMANKEDALGTNFWENRVKDTPLARDSRYFRPDGMSPEDLVNAWRGAHGVGGQNIGAGESDAEILDHWLDAVEKARDLRAASRVAADKGWDATSHLEAAQEVKNRLSQVWGQEVAEQLWRNVASGHPNVVAAEIEAHLNDILGSEHVRETAHEREVAVANALENDRANEEQRGGGGPRSGRATLDTIGKAMYDQRVAEGQAGVQGQILGQRQAQLGAAAQAGAERARAQGQTEGALLGRSQQLGRQAEGELATGERQQASGRAIIGQAPELQQQAAARMAGPMADVYREVGKRMQTRDEIAKTYAKEQAAMDRLDEGLRAKYTEMMNSVEAQPRAARPILEMGQRLHSVLTAEAEKADKDLGEGAGDVYRTMAAEATLVTYDTFSRFGIDPQFLIGERETNVPAERSASDRVSGGPVVGRTGKREAGVGLKTHAGGYEGTLRATRARAFQEIKNVTAEHVIRTMGGGRLVDVLREHGYDATEATSKADLANALKENGLVAWDLADRRGGLVSPRELDLNTRVVPRETWKAWQRYEEHPPTEGPGQTFLKGYDRTTRAMKKLFRLSPRWQVAITLGHAVMGLSGVGFDAPTYFGRDIPLAIKLDRLTREGGPRTPEDIAFVRSLPPDVQAALAEKGGVPGSVRERGFVKTDSSLRTDVERTKVGTRPMRVQSTLDNINRTAIWLHNLEKGLDARGLADFRAQFPELAHLTDTQIKNEAAIRLSIRTMGDYLNMTPFERKVVSRVVFFYPWLRHITKLALNTAIHDPLRTAWILHMGAMFDPGAGPTDWLNRSYHVGGDKWVTMPSWNPYDAIVPFTDNPLGGLNPMIATAIGGATGFNMSTGKPITRPFFEPDGRLSSLSELANYGVNQIPLIPAARQGIPALWGSTAVARYQTGQPIILTKGGVREIPANETQYLGTNSYVPGAVAPWMPYLGLPYQRNIATDEIIANQQKQDAANQKLAKQYAVRRALLGSG